MVTTAAVEPGDGSRGPGAGGDPSLLTSASKQVFNTEKQGGRRNHGDVRIVALRGVSERAREAPFLPSP